MTDNKGYNNSSGGAVGTYSNLQSDQVFRNRNDFKNNDMSSNKNQWKNDDVFSSKNPWKKDNPYASNNVYEEDGVQKEQPKYKRFSDLKILNELMLHMSNNTLDENSRIEILSQGEKGEIKNLLATRILKIALIPALTSLLMGCIFMFSENFILDIFVYMVYVAILVRTVFYPAKLYYENIKYTTTRPAKMFFEEMDYWYKVSVVNIFVFLTVVSLSLFILSFYQEEIINEILKFIPTYSIASKIDKLTAYLSTINFSTDLRLLVMFNVLVFFSYIKFINNEKSKEELELKNRLKKIRNETISRVEQIQQDKNNY
jgi:hypothetical protein